MTRNRISKAVRNVALVVLNLLIVGVLLILPAQAANPSQSPSIGQGIGFTYDSTKEVTLVGTVERFLKHPDTDGSAGAHLIISVSGKTIDAHLGPYLSVETQEALNSAQTVQVIGVNESVNGKDFLLARQLIFNGRQVAIRNERGFLVREHVPHRTTHDSKPAVTGAAQ